MANNFKFYWALMDGYLTGYRGMSVYSNEGGFQATVAEWFFTNSIDLCNVDYCHIYEEVGDQFEMVGFMIPNNLSNDILQDNWSLDMHEVAVEFLGECDQEWDGDDSGVTISCDEGDTWDHGGPGDFVVLVGGVYSILRITTQETPK